MTPEEHKERHVELHGMLDELLADFILHAGGRLRNSIDDLMQWSHKQTKEPDHPSRENVEKVENNGD